MSEFLHLCTDTVLWDPNSSAMRGSLDFCLLIKQFHVPTIRQTQLTALSQTGTWGNVENPRQDMAFLLIAPSLTIGCKRIFGLMALWAHPHQAHLVSLVEVVWHLILMADEGLDWLYMFICMNDPVLHVPLSSEGHLSI